MKTYSAKQREVKQNWFLVDAKDKTLGRISAKIASILQGKNKPEYTPHIDVGDYIVVINADRVQVTGKKYTDKIYYRHTGYPGGIRQTSFKDMMASFPERAIEQAVKGMLPRSKLGRAMFTKLKVYRGDQHNHEAQKPVFWNCSFGSREVQL